MDETLTSAAVSRRDFAQRMMLGVGGVLAADGVTEATAADDAVAPKPVSQAEQILEQLIASYPSDQWTDKVRASVLADIESDLARSRRLWAFPISGNSEPATVFPATVFPVTV